jgi:dienelactone hydrolase
MPGDFYMWYPAVANQQPTLTLGNYLQLSHDLKGAEDGFEHNNAALLRTLNAAVTGRNDPQEDKLNSEILEMPLAAVRDAIPAAGRFPLIFWTHRYATTSAQCVLNEYLASHGFVVVYAPERTVPPMPYELKSSNDKDKEFNRLDLRLRDALSESRQMPNVRPDRIAVIAWSYAGESAFALQQFEAEVSLVIGLTANVLDHWVYREDQLAKVNGAQLTVPYVLLDGAKKERPQVMAKAAARSFFVHIPEMAHGSFNVLEGMLPSVMGIATVPEWSKAGPLQQLGYEVAAQYVLRSCEHYLKAIPTLDTPFVLWNPDGDLPHDFVTVEEGGTAPSPPQQPQFSKIEFFSSDLVQVSADLYSAGNKNAPTIVLVHQSGASRGEYRQIAPKLKDLGFNAIAIDTRWGELDRWNGVMNETAARYGTPAIVATGDVSRTRPVQEAAAQDIRAALTWLAANGYSGAKLLWGSSISANLVLKVAADPAQGVAAVLAFSPGEYHRDRPTEVQSAISGLAVPVLIACGVDEEDTSKPIFDAVPNSGKLFYRAMDGRHGSSILIDDPDNWNGIIPFLVKFKQADRHGDPARAEKDGL